MSGLLFDIAIAPDPFEVLTEVLPYLVVGLLVSGAIALAVVLIVVFTRKKRKK